MANLVNDTIKCTFFLNNYIKKLITIYGVWDTVLVTLYSHLLVYDRTVFFYNVHNKRRPGQRLKYEPSLGVAYLELKCCRNPLFE